jgi:hypothetical protein
VPHELFECRVRFHFNPAVDVSVVLRRVVAKRAGCGDTALELLTLRILLGLEESRVKNKVELM